MSVNAPAKEANAAGRAVPMAIPPIPDGFSRSLMGEWHMALVRLRVKLHIALLALKTYRSVKKTRAAIQHFMDFKRKAVGRDGRRKITLKNNRYWFGPYIPPFPSANFDRFILTEFNRYVPHGLPVNAYQQVNFAITTHCPMRCEHCFEWDNLNHPETFSLGELQHLTGKLQQDGLGHISLSGGEPMVRFHDMLELIRSGEKSTQWWVLTSGFNLTEEKARRLKEAGASGVVISIDHYEPEVHNLFRGHTDAFAHAARAAMAAHAAGLVLAISVCVTRATANRDFLMKHAALAARLGADFVQWLEPRAEGHYRHKDVMLQQGHIAEMESLFEKLNHDATYSAYPSIIYHGYYQRRVGCVSGGKMSFYVDAAGMVHSCPFCHSSDFKITDWLGQPMDARADVTPCKEF